jgi:hypothetical protein
MSGQGAKQLEPWEGRVELGLRIVSAEVPEPPVTILAFADGRRATMSFQRLLDVGKVFEPPRDPDLFRTAHPGGGGTSLEWIAPDGCEIDFGAGSLRRTAENQAKLHKLVAEMQF